MKNGKGKEITIDDLAVMVQKGFAGVDKRFDGVDKRFDRLETRMDGMEMRLENIESSLREVRIEINQMWKKLEEIEGKLNHISKMAKQDIDMTIDEILDLKQRVGFLETELGKLQAA